MMAFKTDNRIASYTLYNNLRNVVNLLDNAEQMSLKMKCNNYIFRFILKLDWFFKDFEDRKSKYKKIKA